MTGHWPPERDSPEEEFSGEPYDDDALGTAAEARLAEVTAFLAAVPDPVLPASVEGRISAAIAREAESAGTRSEVADLSAFATRTRWRRLRSRKVMAPVAAGLVLVLGVGGYFASATTGSTASNPTSASAASGATGSGQQLYSAGESGQAAAGSAARPAALPTASGSAAGPAAQFVVTRSGTSYQRATLAAQARAETARYARDRVPGASAPAPSPASAGAPVSASAPVSAASSEAGVSGSGTSTSAPSVQLRGCVAQLTGGSDPRLVDSGTYAGTPAYVIVGVSEVWVVGLGCTAGQPELLASASLAG
jgi:hypothetical protein